MLQKVINTEIKEVKGIDRTLEFIGSTESVDRVGDIIEVAGWNLKEYKANPVFLWAHRYDEPPIGKATKVWKSNGQLKFHIEFAPAETYEFADTIYKLYKGGFLNAVSVGFDPKEWDEIETKDGGMPSGGRRYKKQDLLEISAVPVPANPEALQNAVTTGAITVKQLKAITKPEEIDDYIRIPAPGEEGKHDKHRIRTIGISEEEGIKALYCGECKVVITYLFDKEKGWTMAKAKKWVEEHKRERAYLLDFDGKFIGVTPHNKNVEAITTNNNSMPIAYGEILIEEIEALSDIIAEENLSEESKTALIQLAEDIKNRFGIDLEAEKRTEEIVIEPKGKKLKSQWVYSRG